MKIVLFLFLSVVSGFCYTLSNATLSGVSEYTAIEKRLAVWSPVTRQVLQRGTNHTGNIPIRGFALGYENIQARWNGGTWVTIATNVSGPFFGTLTNQTEGVGTLDVRLATSTSYTVTITNLGIGIVIVAGGQSNFDGAGVTLNEFTHPTVFGSSFTGWYGWAPLNDPTHNFTNWSDIVSYNSFSRGSVHPIYASFIATNYNVPIAVANASKGATYISQWTTNSYRATMLGQLIARGSTNFHPNGIQVVLWDQGEGEAGLGWSSDQYQSNLTYVAGIMYSNIGAKVMPCTLSTNGATYVAHANIENINTGIRRCWTNVLFFHPGPDMVAVPLSDDGIHWKDAAFPALAALWRQAITNAFSP